MRTPDKWIRKYFATTLNNLVVSGKTIPIADFRLPNNSNAYILMTTEDKTHVQENKCNKVWNFSQTLDIVTVYDGNSGSRLLCDDIQETVLNACNNISIEHFTVIDKGYEFAPDLSTQTTTNTIFRKIIIFNLKLIENGS